MRSIRAFTLVEMLAVVSIMLVLLGVSYGILTSLAQQTGPDAMLVTVQAAIHNARDYAAGRGVPARIEFRCTDPGSDDPMPSSTMRLQYWSDAFNDWVDVPGRESFALPQGLYVCKGFPSALPQSPTSVPDDPTKLTDDQVEEWQKHEQEVLDAVSTHALTAGSPPQLKSEHDEFYIVYGPEGYPITPQDGARLTNLNLQSGDLVGATGNAGLTLVRASGSRVSAYAFYLWNQNAGTRLIFE